jgi:hypothetical protein
MVTHIGDVSINLVTDAATVGFCSKFTGERFGEHRAYSLIENAVRATVGYVRVRARACVHCG